MLKYLWNYFKKRMKSERGSWVAVAIGGSAVLGVGAGLLGGDSTSTQDQTQTFKAGPEAQKALTTWSDTLQNWGQQPGYGAIQPDWDQIWNLASQKIQQYYSGTALSPGVNDAIKASVAGRNVGDSSTPEVLKARMGIEQGQQMANFAGQEAIQKTQTEQTGQQTWLNSLQALASSTQGGTQSGTSTTTSPTDLSGITSSLGQGLGTLAAQNNQKNWLSQLSALLGKGNTPNLGSSLGTNPSSANLSSYGWGG